MPFVRISAPATSSVEQRRAIAAGVHRALVDALGIPAGDRFQLISSYRPDEGVFDPDYLDVARQDVVVVEITLVRGRTDEQKRALYGRIKAELVAAGVRSEDVFVTLTENDRADWSVGDGQAQVLDLPRPDLAEPVAERLAFTVGSDARNRLAASSDPGRDGALAALESFYHALNHADLDLLEAVWLDDPLVQLNNPLGGILRGREQITALYARVFSGPVRLGVRFEEIVAFTPAPTAIIFAGRERGSYGDLELAIRTTRCFTYQPARGGWRQTHHHGSIDDPEQLRRYQQAVAG
ncbi:MAG: tautomerase family protein [Solirubrobacterales bacterium]|nr:tautomerase family protein [Solirubrobacterales bacterium]